MALDYNIYLGEDELIDPLGSVIVNLNASGGPGYSWVGIERLKAYGFPTHMMPDVIPHKSTISYKIKHMDFIPEHDTDEWTLGDNACLGSPSTCNKRGPFYILGRKYYIDFMFMYFFNSGTETIYSPVFSVDDARCDENYGYFIGSPAVNVNTVADTTTLLDTSTRRLEYTNDLGCLAENVMYKFTTVTPTHDGIVGNLEINSIINLVESTITNGQDIIAAEDANGAPLVLNPGQFHPFILFRYVSENAPTRQVGVTFKYGPTLG